MLPQTVYTIHTLAPYYSSAQTSWATRMSPAVRPKYVSDLVVLHLNGIHSGHGLKCSLGTTNTSMSSVSPLSLVWRYNIPFRKRNPFHFAKKDLPSEVVDKSPSISHSLFFLSSIHLMTIRMYWSSDCTLTQSVKSLICGQRSLSLVHQTHFQSLLGACCPSFEFQIAYPPELILQHCHANDQTLSSGS